MPKHLVTLLTMDGEAGANPFWHAALVLSKQEAEAGPILVEDAVGYYSQPSSTTNPVIRSLKTLLGFTIDLQDSHGVLQQEKMRYLDGNGLHGVTFEVTERQYMALKALYAQRMADEAASIKETNERLASRGLPQNGYTRYLEEQAIARERTLATGAVVAPRLRPFHITMTLNRNGFDSSASHACKNYALSLLVDVGIIDTPTQAAIIGGAAKHAFPRFTGLSPQSLCLVSKGDPEEVRTSAGKYFYNRAWGHNQLYWATNPIIYNGPGPAPSTTDNFKVIKNVLSRARKVEFLLLQEIRKRRSHGDAEQLDRQLARVQAVYDNFSIAGDNSSLTRVITKALQAETVLNVATLSLTPERVNYSFMLRAIESIAMRKAFIALMVLAITAAFITTPAGAVIATAATVYGSYQAAHFFRKEEPQFAKMRSDYLAYQHEHNRAPAEGAGGLTPATA